MAKLSIVVLQYNKSDYTLKCLEALKAFDVDVIVVDNGSEVQHLKNVEYWIATQKLKNFKLLNSETNLGYSGGNNIGIKYALEHGAEKILILNNDVVLEELPTGDADIIGVERGNVFDFDYVSGAVMLVKREVFEKIGLFDERYFLYYEDVEFCVRAQCTGFTLDLAKPKFSHAVSASTSALGPANLLYYHTRNSLLLLHDHGTWWQKFGLPFRQVWIMAKQKIKIALGDHREESIAILDGAKDYQKRKFGQR